MKPYLLALSLALVPVTAFAADYQPTPWQQKAAESLPKQFKKVLEVYWQQDISLWLRVRRDGTDWQAANRHICLALKGAGKPADALVIVRYVDADREDLTFIDKATCPVEPKPKPVDTTSQPEDLGVMGSDGVIRSDAEAEAFEASKKR